MRYLALATDYDGTLASQGKVDANTIAALEKLSKSGRKLILVSGREREDLLKVFPRIDLFDKAVLENGALLYDPKTKAETPLSEPPPENFVRALQERGVPVSVGRSIVATWHPHENTVLEVIKDLGLELHVIFNKGAVMVLPSTVNKATGLAEALKELSLSAHNVVAIGDAENDHAFLAASECAVAVANALPSLKERADIVTTADHGAGVVEIIDRLLSDDLADEAVSQRHRIVLGSDAEDHEVTLPTFGPCILIAGPSGSGKSTSVTAILERLCDQQYQFCVVDPEGDYEEFLDSVTVGAVKIPPQTREVKTLLQQYSNIAVNLLGIPLADRPAYFAELLPMLQQMRTNTGRPHWMVIDEVHHLLPESWMPASTSVPQSFKSSVMITVHPDHVSKCVLELVDTIIAVGAEPESTIAKFCEATKRRPPALQNVALDRGQVLFWRVDSQEAPIRVKVQPARSERQRHRRKYAEGDIHEKSFIFRGPEGKLNLRAQNLVIFLQMAEGLDDDTWNFHLERHDYSHWIKEAIKDQELSERVAEIEDQGLSAKESRDKVREAISEKYTQAA